MGTCAGQIGGRRDPARMRGGGTWCGRGGRSVAPSLSLWGGEGIPGARESKVSDGVMVTEPVSSLLPPSSSLKDYI